LLPGLPKSFSAYKRNTFGFAWATLLYIFLLLVVALASVGLFLIYFMIASSLNQPIFSSGSNPAPATIVVGVIIGIFFLILSSGLNSALASAYKDAVNSRKTSLAQFYGNALRLMSVSFSIQLVRDILWLIVVGIPIVIYFTTLKSYQYADVLVTLHSLFWTFILHMLFTPSLMYAGAYNIAFMPAIKRGFNFIQRKHIYFVALYFIFAVLWLLNLIPLIGLVSIFLAYPILYGAIVVALE
jgi:hypothetical protein